MANTIDNKAKQPQQKTTGFSNIQDIVRANRQNRLGQTVSSGVSNVIGKGQEDLSNVKQQFQQGAQAGAIGTAADQAYVQQQIQAPNASQENIDRFAKLRAGQYAGPTELGNQEQLIAQGQDLSGLANAATGEYGRRGLLQRFVAPNQYTQGQQRMDTLLLGQTGGQALNQARRQANLFGQQLAQAQQGAQAEAEGLRQQSQQFGNQVGQQLQGAQSGLQTAIQQRADLQKQQAEAGRAALQALLTKPKAPDTSQGGYTTMPVGGGFQPNITQEQYDLATPFLQQTGLADDQIMGLQNLVGSPEELIGQGIIAPTRAQVTTEDEKARSIALAKLAGLAPTDITEQTQVGGYDPLSFLNKDLYQQRIGEGEAKYNEGVEKRKQADAVTAALAKAQEAQRMLQADLPSYQSGKFMGGIGNAQQRLAQQQDIYNQANALLGQAGLRGTGAGLDTVSYYAPPGDQGQWQNYNVPEMLNLLRNTTDARNKAARTALQRVGRQESDYARIPLLERLQSLIGSK